MTIDQGTVTALVGAGIPTLMVGLGIILARVDISGLRGEILDLRRFVARKPRQCLFQICRIKPRCPGAGQKESRIARIGREIPFVLGAEVIDRRAQGLIQAYSSRQGQILEHHQIPGRQMRAIQASARGSINRKTAKPSFHLQGHPGARWMRAAR
jgi:hypothetical protein